MDSSEPTTAKKVPIAGRLTAPRPWNFLVTRTVLARLTGPNPSGLAEICLQRTDLEISSEVGLDAKRGRDGPMKSGVVRNFMQEGGLPEGPAVGQRLGPLGGIEDDLDLPVLDGVDDMRAPFQHLVDLGGLDPVLGEEALGSGGGDDLEAERAEQPGGIQ